MHRLFRNNGNSNHFIKVNLTGVQSNLHGIGARVTVTYTGGMSFRENNGGGGGEYASQGSEPLHFGIGTATEATIVVNWPSGVVDAFYSVAANSTLTVVEGSGSPTPIPVAPTAKPASDVTANSFTANWSSVTDAAGYRLDVSTRSSFGTYLPGYQDLDVGNVTSYGVTGLTASTTYYYRLRAYNISGTSTNSNVIKVRTKNH